MHSPRLLPVLITAALVTVGCANEAPSAPTPMKVAFDDGWGQVFLADTDGSALQQITPTTTVDSTDDRYSTYPALSPDGTQLAYTRAGRFIDIVDLDSGESHTLYEGGYQPVFSPDGTSIAFSSSDGISIMNADGTDVRVIVEQDSAFGAAFFPDGSRVVFATDGYLAEVPVTGGEPAVLLRDQFWNQDPVYSPDGSTLVFVSNRGGNNGSEIYAMPAGGGPIIPLTATYAVHPQFTPDSSRILYTRATTPDGTPVTDIATSTHPELASMNPDGTDQTRLTPRSITAQNPSAGGGQ